MASGGYRQPSSPAPVSGPGALSQRTDGGPSQPIRVPTGGQYGQAQQLQQLQKAAPLAADPGAAGAQPGLLAGLNLPQGVGFGEPTQQPNTPVTAGAATGPGPGTEALGLTNPQDADLKA